LLKLFPPEARPRQQGVLIEIYRKGKVAEAFRAFKKIYLEIVNEVIDHLKSQEADAQTGRNSVKKPLKKNRPTHKKADTTEGHDGFPARRTRRALKMLGNWKQDDALVSSHPSVLGDGYWGLKYFNHPERFLDCPEDLYSFARFQSGSARALVVVANFRPGAAVQGRIRIPQELVAAVGFTSDVGVRLLLDREGRQDVFVATVNVGGLTRDGFPVSVSNQSAYVYAIAGS
jgi:hypothetical protein